MIKLAVSGCHGRMGQRISALATEDKDLKLTTVLEHTGHPKAKEDCQGIQVSTSPEALKGNDVLIEFTTPEATIHHLKACVANKVKMVIGTTGFTKDQIAEIEKAARTIPIVFASNMSVGVNILFKLAEQLGKVTGESYTVKIVEAHHVHKKDAPSGTAKTLAERVKAGSGREVRDIESIREGEIIGDHEVIFESPVDVISIRHHAKTRDIFAKGALVAAKFLKDQSKGLFSMQDVLNLK